MEDIYHLTFVFLLIDWWTGLSSKAMGGNNIERKGRSFGKNTLDLGQFNRTKQLHARKKKKVKMIYTLYVAPM